ncbi:MAG TPA: hypothetical protein PK752_10970, partial [Accumulibacter sp.]|uniref:hypothetical protein n=1 Tax=Accumulibacter sp. TaxID=2053492 RepID=UPI002CB12C0C
PATAPRRVSPATSCSSSPCLLSIPSSEEGILGRTTSAGKNAGWLPVTLKQRIGVAPANVKAAHGRP